VSTATRGQGAKRPRAGPGARLEAVQPSDAVWLQDSPTNMMVINAVYTTDHVDLDTARAIFQERVLDKDGGRAFPRFRKRVVYRRGRPYWEDDPDFDIARHIVPAATDRMADADALRAYISAEAGKVLDPEQPLWRIQHVADYEDGGSAFVVRLHHAMADGIAILPIIFSLMDEVRPDERLHVMPVRPLISRVRTALTMPILGPLAVLQRVLWSRDRHALHGPQPSGAKRVAWTRPFPLETIKHVKNKFGATVNDVLMATVSGAIGRYVEERTGVRIPHVRISMPVNMRGPREVVRMENRFTAVPLTLPAPRDLRARLAATKIQLDQLKGGLTPLAIYGVVQLFLTALPFGISRRLIDFFANKCTSVVTNVPGPTHELTFGGRRLRQLMFWVPQRATIGVGISILTFAGNVQLGVIADTRLIEDPGDLVAALEAELEAVAAHAG
jgi:diacylglycerol O-acyltransferase / wax synthase